MTKTREKNYALSVLQRNGKCYAKILQRLAVSRTKLYAIK